MGGMCSWAGDTNDHNYCGLKGGSNPWYVPGKLPDVDNLPVGWAFQILPYIEEGNALNEPDWDKVKHMTFAFYFCPSRRGPTHNSHDTDHGYLNGLMDYASATPAKSFTDVQPWRDFWGNRPKTDVLSKNYNFMGMVVCTKSCSRIGFNDVKDGLSKTLLISEKFLPLDNYDGGGPVLTTSQLVFEGDDRGWSDGWDYDIVRSTGVQPRRDKGIPTATYNDPSNSEYFAEQISFGSAHSAGVNAVFGDGSVHTISYDIDLDVFNKLGNRNDGQVLDYGKWVN